MAPSKAESIKWKAESRNPQENIREIGEIRGENSDPEAEMELTTDGTDNTDETPKSRKQKF